MASYLYCESTAKCVGMSSRHRTSAVAVLGVGCSVGKRGVTGDPTVDSVNEPNDHSNSSHDLSHAAADVQAFRSRRYDP